jgi:hemoglobin
MKTLTSTLLAIAICGLTASGLGAADTDRQDSLYQRLGGMPAIQAVVDDFVGRILADDRVNHYFAHAAADPANAKAYQGKLADLICQATGGPCHYTGADMITAHKGRGVTEAAFNAVVSDLVATLEKFKVPEKEKGQLLGLLAPMKSMIVQEKQ